MPTLTPTREVRGARGTVRAVTKYNGGQKYYSLQYNGSEVGSAQGSDSEKTLEAKMKALADGVPFQPTVHVGGQELTREQALERRVEQLEYGQDCTREVSTWVRYLAAEEARQDGDFAQTLQSREIEQWPAFVRDAFSSLFGVGAKRVEQLPAGADWIKRLLDKAEGMPEWQSLTELAKGDPWACGIAAGQLARVLSNELDELLKKLPEQDPQRLQDEADATAQIAGEDSDLAKAAQKRANKERAKAVSVAVQIDKKGDEVKQAVIEAVDDAVTEINETREAMAAFGAGSEPGVLSKIDVPAPELRAALKNNPTLRRVAQIAGRLRMHAKKKQRSKTKYVPEEIVDVTVGGELSRLLPSELGQLMTDETEAMIFRKITEHQALQYEMEGTEQVDQGPVIMAVDASGSMFGQHPYSRYEWAVGCALALLEICCIQKRPFFYFAFDTQVLFTVEVPDPLKITLAQIEEIVNQGSAGGTKIQVALNKTSELVQRGEWKKADLILLTDGEDHWDLKRLIEQRVAVYVVAIGARFAEKKREGLTGYVEIVDVDVHSCDAKIDAVFGI